jgi:Amt family ammonium transporter
MTGGDSLTEDLNLFYNAGDIAWMITSTALVLLMIPGVGYAILPHTALKIYIDN